MDIRDGIPKVTGRHRNHALAALRRERALKLRAQGRSFQSIADEMGYSGRGQVFRMVRQAMDAHQVEGVDFLRMVENDRLDSVMRAAWTKAMDGDYKAMRVVLETIDKRVKLNGLDRLGESVAQRPRTVVVSPDQGN